MTAAADKRAARNARVRRCRALRSINKRIASIKVDADIADALVEGGWLQEWNDHDWTMVQAALEAAVNAMIAAYRNALRGDSDDAC